MKNKKPFIHLFSTPDGYYIYDVNTNAIIRTSNDVYNLLSEMMENETSITEIADTGKPEITHIQEMASRGFLSSDTVGEIVHPANDSLPYYMYNKIRGITLQVTQQCNLRCEYCAYSGSYNNRLHSNKCMSMEIAKQAIDFAIDHSKDNPTIAVGFYGGEPLLMFDMIKNCVDYIKGKYEGKRFTYHMTTNGTIMNKEIIDFLAENDVSVLVSLDGPREIQDSNRKFVNHKGTYDEVIKNLNLIKDIAPDYFKKIRFNAVLDGKNDFGCINSYFKSCETVKEGNLTWSFVSDAYVKKKYDISDEFNIFIEYEYFKILLNKLNRIGREHTSKMIISRFDRLKFFSDDRYISRKDSLKKAHPGGPCIPGGSKLFVDVHGNLFPCERVSELSKIMKIGDLNTGIDIAQIRSILNIGSITPEKCKICWAFRFCNLCAVAADIGTELSAEKKVEKCAMSKYNALRQLKDYCTLRELGYDFDDDNYMSLI